MKKLIPIIAMIIALFTVSIAAAQTLANVVITPNTDSVTVGDPIELTVTVNHLAGTQVLIPTLEPNWGDFIVRSQSAVETVENGDGTATSTQIIDVRLFAPGAFETPPLSVSIADSNGQIFEVSAAPIPFTVNSVLVEGDTELRDIKPQATLPNPYIWPVFIAALGALIATAVWFFARRVKEAFDNRLPHEVALNTLAAVEKEQLPENGRFKEHYTLVTAALRAYVEQTQGIQATDRTTAEIKKELAQAQATTSLTTEQAKQFITILSESDLVKFAKFTPDIDSAYALVAESRQFIQDTKPEPAENDKNSKKKDRKSGTQSSISNPQSPKPEAAS